MKPLLKRICLLIISGAGLISVTGAQYTTGLRFGKSGEQVTSTLNSLLNGYDKRVRPNMGGHPVDVGVTMYILSVESLDEVKMEFKTTFYVRQRWRDSRIKYVGYSGNITVPGNELSDKIWIPDTFIVNQRAKIVSDSDTRLFADGDVLRVEKIQLTANCPMDFQYFPFDKQSCSIEMESFASSMVDIKYNFASGMESVKVSREASLPQWKLVGHTARVLEQSLSTGNYSRLVLHIHFARATGYCIVTLYLPAAILVVLTWISFWMSSNAMTARILTGVVSVLFLLHQLLKLTSSMPKISYVKAADIYFVACLGMILVALFENALITCLITRKKQFKKSMQYDISRGGSRRTPCCLEAAPLLLDWLFRLAFPALFAGFNFWYWTHFLRAAATFYLNLDPNFVPL